MTTILFLLFLNLLTVLWSQLQENSTLDRIRELKLGSANSIFK